MPPRKCVEAPRCGAALPPRRRPTPQPIARISTPMNNRMGAPAALRAPSLGHPAPTTGTSCSPSAAREISASSGSPASLAKERSHANHSHGLPRIRVRHWWLWCCCPCLCRHRPYLRTASAFSDSTGINYTSFHPQSSWQTTRVGGAGQILRGRHKFMRLETRSQQQGVSHLLPFFFLFFVGSLPLTLLILGSILGWIFPLQTISDLCCDWWLIQYNLW
jgi:hypothetical protein